MFILERIKTALTSLRKSLIQNNEIYKQKCSDLKGGSVFETFNNCCIENMRERYEKQGTIDFIEAFFFIEPKTNPDYVENYLKGKKGFLNRLLTKKSYYDNLLYSFKNHLNQITSNINSLPKIHKYHKDIKTEKLTVNTNPVACEATKLGLYSLVGCASNSKDIREANSTLGAGAMAEEIIKTCLVATAAKKALSIGSNLVKLPLKTLSVYKPNASEFIRFGAFAGGIGVCMAGKSGIDKLWVTDYEKSQGGIE